MIHRNQVENAETQTKKRKKNKWMRLSDSAGLVGPEDREVRHVQTGVTNVC